jgi:hypothetical protein
MKTTDVIPMLTAGLGLLLLAGCVGGGGGNSAILDEFSTACMFETNAKGSYVYGSGDSEVKPGRDGSVDGAAAINACIRRKAAEAGKTMDPAPAASGTRQTVEVETAGGGMVTETFTYGQPPASTAAAPAATEACRRRDVFTGGAGYFGCSR